MNYRNLINETAETQDDSMELKDPVKPQKSRYRLFCCCDVGGKSLPFSIDGRDYFSLWQTELLLLVFGVIVGIYTFEQVESFGAIKYVNRIETRPYNKT